MKKTIALLLTVGMLLALLAGCGGTNKTGSGQEGAPVGAEGTDGDLETGGASAIDDRPASNCWTVNASISQRPNGDHGEYRIQMDATHTNPELHNAGAIVALTFNQTVTVTNAGGGAWVNGSDTGSTVSIEFDIGTANANESKGWGDLAVTADAGLEIVDVSVQCTGI